MFSLRRSSKIFAASVLLVTSFAAGGAVGAADPVLAVTPATGLVDGQTVTITTPAAWTANPDNAGGYYLCATADLDNDNCEFLAVPPAVGTTAVSVPARFFTVGDMNELVIIDCRTTSCSLRAFGWGASGDTVVAGAITLGFDPGAPLRTPPTITATPATGLVDGQQVAVSVTPATAQGSDFGAGANAFQCAQEVTTLADLDDLWSKCSIDQYADLVGPVGGTATGSIAVRAYVGTSGGPVDCRAPGATCNLVTIDPVGQIASVPLAFDPGAPVHPALLQRLSDGSDTTTFDLVGFTPNDPFTVRWCTESGACLADSATIARGVLDANGIGTFTFPAYSFPEFDVDTSICSDGCTMTAMDAHGLTASGGYSFVTEAPEEPFVSQQLPVTVTPNRDLKDGSVVTVTASGFMPGASLSIIQCVGSARLVGEAACDFDTSSFLNGQTITADAQGRVSATYTIRRHIQGPDGPVDCASGNVDPDAYAAGIAVDPSRADLLDGHGYFSCILGIANLADYSESGGVPIAFQGARFKPLPWEVVPSRPRPATPRQSAPAARPVAAQPTFTG